MRKSELFAEILECVAFETEITKEQILSKDKYQDVVDARYMLVHFCHEKGMYITDIARMMRFSRRAVEKIRDLNIDAYDWNVRVYFAVTCYHTDSIIKSLNDIQCPAELMDHIRDNLLKCDMDTGFTYSNKKLRRTVMIVGLASSPAEFLNSFEHELRHLVDDIASTHSMDMAGEEVAYLTGDINTALWSDIHRFTCCKCDKHGR